MSRVMSGKRIWSVIVSFLIIMSALGTRQVFAQGPTPTPAPTATAPQFNKLFGAAGPNGQYVFSSNKTGQFCLNIMDDRTVVKELYCSPAKGDLLPSWSSDGKLIAFEACELGQQISGCELWVIGSDGTNPRQLAQNYIPSALSRLTWTAEGDIVFSATAKTGIKDLYKVNPTTGTVVQITKNTQENDKDPVYANGKLYTACSKSDYPGICIVNADGTTTMVYQITGVILYMPDVCPKDGRLAFAVSDAGGQTASITYQNNLGGLSSFDAVFGPTWSSDCSHIIFTKPNEAGNFKLWSMKVDSMDAPVLLTGTGAAGSFQGLVPPTKTPTPQ